jgi:hypothetical protein
MSLIGAEKLSALLTDSQTPCAVRGLRRLVRAEIGHRAVAYYAGHKMPRLVVTWHNAARQFASVPPIPLILLGSRQPQIRPSIIRRIAVYVIDRFRPFAGLHKPDHTVCGELTVIQRETDVSVSVRYPDALPAETGIPRVPRRIFLEMVRRSLAPSKRAGLGVIHKALSKVLNCGQPFTHWGSLA